MLGECQRVMGWVGEWARSPLAWGRDLTSGGVERGIVRARRTVWPAEWRVLR